MFDYLAEICYNSRKAIESIGEKMSFRRLIVSMTNYMPFLVGQYV